jgi:cobyrinic acid a,c-diamide synthase
MQRIPRLLVSGIGCGVGKTTVLLTLAAALRQRGLVVAAFTLGPDGHDAPLLESITGRPAHCLDPWLMGRQTLRRTFRRGAEGADIALVEGALGLFDGLSPTSDEGSSAELARWLELPVLLVLDGSNLGGSVAAIARGFERFDPRVPIGGFVTNFVDGPGHVGALRAALEAGGSARLLGALPLNEALRHAGRDLGSAPRDARWLDGPRRSELARAGERGFDLDALLELARGATPLPPPLELVGRARCTRIGVALDAAFDRHFEDDLARLEAAGAELVVFSPLVDTELPEVDGLYFGDGNVEGYTAELSRNAQLRQAVRAAIARGAPTVALGGGLLYLSCGVRSLSGALHPLVGAIDADFVCTAEPALAGYVEVETTCATLLGPEGTRVRGHAWRHARLSTASEARASQPSPVRALIGPEVTGHGGANLIALPLRTHWASSPKVPEALVAACVQAAALLI